MRTINRIFLCILSLSLLSICTLSAQENELSVGHELGVIIASKFKIPKLVPSPPPNYWKRGTFFQSGFSQMALSNWSSGGYSSVALNAYINTYANYSVKTFFWESRLQVAYGFIQSFGDRYKKSDDKFIIDSKFGYKAWENVFASAVFNFRTQMSNGFDYPKNTDPRLTSGPFSPAYLSLGLGVDYKSTKNLSITFSPLAGNVVIVQREELRKKYGNPIDQAASFKLGAQLKMDYGKNLMKNVNLVTSATFFSDFLEEPENIKVNWDLFIDAKINKFFSTNIRTNLIYDDDVLIADNDGDLSPRIQFKEILSVGFSYTFGEFKK
ncbi:MAG: DUF3078 domain-containing protein [Rikenellaceae bacterium]